MIQSFKISFTLTFVTFEPDASTPFLIRYLFGSCEPWDIFVLLCVCLRLSLVGNGRNGLKQRSLFVGYAYVLPDSDYWKFLLSLSLSFFHSLFLSFLVDTVEQRFSQLIPWRLLGHLHDSFYKFNLTHFEVGRLTLPYCCRGGPLLAPLYILVATKPPLYQ